MDFPLSQLITNESAPSQRWFAQEATPCVPSNVYAEATDGGLVIQANTELELELACGAVLQSFPGARVHKPQVRYLEGSPLQEPYYRIMVLTPEDCLGDVMADLNSRRASLALLQDTDSGKRLSAEIPLNECFGYGTQLRALTRGRGSYEVEFIGYRPCWRSDDGSPVNVT